VTTNRAVAVRDAVNIDTRRPRGRRGANRKLTEEEVRVILVEHHFGATIAELHRAFPHVGRTTIEAVCKRRTWKYVDIYGGTRNLHAEKFERLTR